ncbi:radical SAM family heme chaperone HemW [Roseiconus lacunae]|uniref:Heme chaperone HemW n=1 Tax=Roseiconus lacunae TaxID=2605694 RepID=A0ABT7PPX9_9BACT|nr:radical SAM family heme chaperone HemW [Roseiconus lacunae]MDM4018554.1 radical SAM family heme chaperone HemW [Roseiconus lacunae]
MKASSSITTPSASCRSLYIHVPFCRHRCGYCNFSVVAGRDDLIDRFLDAITLELQSVRSSTDRPPELETVFIGGGTPTHLDHDRLARLLQAVRDRFDFVADAEWSVEANPEDITTDKLRLLRDLGINRVSLGVQSFNDQKLSTLERSHDGQHVRQIIRDVAEVIENVSIDLIFAAPGETLDNWREDLRLATSLPIKHVSTYALTFEKGTAFWSRRSKGDLHDSPEELELQMYDVAREHFAARGFEHYEISNFGKPGFRCRHNLAYWHGAGWYAAGPGAAAFVDGYRNVNHRSTTSYLKRLEAGQSPIAESEFVSAEQSAREAAAFGVRMIDGVDLQAVSERYGVDLLALCETELRQMLEQGLITRQADRICLTERGIHFADSVAGELLG